LKVLPSSLPEIAGYELYGDNLPSRAVSGDFYTVIERADGDEFVHLVADVSGKGIGASLLTCSLEALAAGPIEVGRTPVEICNKVSRRLMSRTPPSKYATMFLGALRPACPVHRRDHRGIQS
jgi:sigma-B regulation protein RsbU (phosphoserine phosphatase)